MFLAQYIYERCKDTNNSEYVLNYWHYELHLSHKWITIEYRTTYKLCIIVVGLKNLAVTV